MADFPEYPPGRTVRWRGMDLILNAAQWNAVRSHPDALGLIDLGEFRPKRLSDEVVDRIAAFIEGGGDGG